MAGPIHGPLHGVKVLELGTLIAAPFASRLFAEFGAEVIKVEDPKTGDPIRNWRYLHDGTSLWWYVQSRNKKSIALEPEGSARAGDRPSPRARGGHRRRELPAGGAGEVGPRLRAVARREPRDGDGAHLRLRADGPDARPPRIRRDRGVDGRHPLRHRLSRSSADSHRHLDRRFDRRAARGGRRADGAAAPGRHRRARQGRRPDGGRRALRGGVQHDGEHAAGIRRVRRGPRPHRGLAAGHRSIEHLRVRGRRGDRGRGQRRRDLSAG